MLPVRIFRHISCEGPGYLAELLEQKKIPYTVVCIDNGESVPETIDDVSALVFMGGSMSVNDPLPWIEDELALIRSAHEMNLPVLGICLGSQLISKALGSQVYPGDKGMELGWHDVQQVATHSWTRELPDTFEVFHWHGETFELPTDAVHLLKSNCYQHQAFALGNTLALQFHVELTAAMIGEWVKLYSDDIERGKNCAQTAAQMLSDIEQRVAHMQDVANKLVGGWLQDIID